MPPYGDARLLQAPATAEGMLALMRRLGLEYGAADFRATPDGEHVFLEVNPAGQFLFIENAIGLKIAEPSPGTSRGRPPLASERARPSCSLTPVRLRVVVERPTPPGGNAVVSNIHLRLVRAAAR